MRPTFVIPIVLVLVLASFPAKAAEPAEPEDCGAAMAKTRTKIMERVPNISFGEAVRLVIDEVIPICGPDLEQPASERDPPLRLEVADDDLEPRCESRDDGCRDTPGGSLDLNALPALVDAAEVVPCSLPGEGDGTIEGYVLGVPLGTWYARGEWAPVNGLTKVAGEAGVLGGIQIEGHGTVLIGPLALPSSGETNAYCIKTTTTTAVKESCWWVVIYWSCTTELSTEAALAPCRADAEQYVLDPALIRMQHEYASDSTPC